jgi:hypothetical protein
VGDVIEALASNAGENDFESDTLVTIDYGTQVVKFHTSCSKPIKVGDQFAGVKVVELTSTNGGTVTLPDPDPDASQCVPPGPPPPPHCEGKVVQAVFEYTGGSCADSQNTQGGKTSCTGVLNGDEPVDIVVTKDVTSVFVEPYQNIFVGDLVTFTASGSELKSELVFSILTAGANPQDELPDDLLQQLNIHTSCSAPLNLGDEFGGMKLVSLTTTEGGTVTIPPPEPPAPTSDCVIPPPAPYPCDQKIGVLSLRYIGGDCNQTTNDQEGTLECRDYAPVLPVEPVRIRAFKDDSKIYLDTGAATVLLGDTVDASASNAGDSELASNTEIEIFDEFGNLVQMLKVHTSCSKPIDLGDVFGSVEVVGLTDKNGSQFLPGAIVEYTYTVTNPGLTEVTNVEVEDNKLGLITEEPIASIAGGDTVVLRETALITEDTENVVRVSYEQGGQECPDASATANVTVEVGEGDDESGDDVNCTSKVQSMLLEYIGPSIDGGVTVKVEADKFRNEPAVYQFPMGLATGTILAMPSENNSTIDATVHGEQELGSKTRLYINSVVEVIHTSCSTPFRAGEPAPLDNPKGAPSSNWFVVSFDQK